MKKKIVCLFLVFCSFNMFSGELQKKFIKGSISEKTSAVTESAGTDEGLVLSNAAIYFILENKPILGKDRDLEALAVAGILTLPNDYGRNLSDSEKLKAVSVIMTVYKEFSDSPNVQIAILNKSEYLNRYLPLGKFTDYLNNYLVKGDLTTEETSKVSAVINCLGNIGNNGTFTVLYNYYYNNTYSLYVNDIENALVKLVPNSLNAIIQIINDNDFSELENIYKITRKNSKISSNFLAEIAENVLKKTILTIGNSKDENEEIVALQMDSINILNESKWTRASSTVLSFFNAARLEYNNGILNEDQFAQIIDCVGNITPIDSVTPLVNYLWELNGSVQNNKPVSQKVALAVINTLGAIGDKTAFDPLLSVTYLSYPENVLTAARKALAGLKW